MGFAEVLKDRMMMMMMHELLKDGWNIGPTLNLKCLVCRDSRV